MDNHSNQFLLFPRIKFGPAVEIFPVPNTTDHQYTDAQLKCKTLILNSHERYTEISEYFSERLGKCTDGSYSLKGFAFPTIEKFNKWFDNLKAKLDL